MYFVFASKLKRSAAIEHDTFGIWLHLLDDLFRLRDQRPSCKVDRDPKHSILTDMSRVGRWNVLNSILDEVFYRNDDRIFMEWLHTNDVTNPVLGGE